MPRPSRSGSCSHHGRTGGNGNRYVGWQDEPLDEVGREQAQAVARLLAGESLHDVFRRVGRLHEELVAELRAGRNVAAVGHFWSLRMLLGVLSGDPFEELFAHSAEYTPENGSVWRMSLVAGPGGGLRINDARWARFSRPRGSVTSRFGARPA